jgi:hypothetical protein
MKFCYFCVAHNTKNFIIKFYILIDYIIDYVLIYFYNFLKLKTVIFNFFKIEEAPMPGSQKHLSSLSSFQPNTLLISSVSVQAYTVANLGQSIRFLNQVASFNID